MAKKTKNKITNSLNWRTVTFGNETLFSVVLGGTPSSKIDSYWNGEVIWITPNDLSSNEKIYISDSERKISKEGLKRSNSSLVPEDSIILSTRAPIGYLAITAKPMTVNQGCKAIVVKDKNKISPEFLYYYLLTQVKLMQAWGSGSTFRELATDDLKSLKIILPNIKIQNKIVLVLNRIRQQINTQKELIENLKELKSALLEKLFTEGTQREELKETEIGKIPKSWKIDYLNQLGEVRTGKTPATNNREYFSGNIPFIKPPLLKSNWIDDSPYKLSVKGATLVGKLPKKSVLVCCIGSIGKIGILAKPSSTNQQINSIIFSMINPFFAFYYMQTSSFQERLKKAASMTTMPIVNKTKFGFLQVPFPQTSEEQERIAEILTNTDQKIEQGEKKLKLLEELFQTTLHKLMSFEIDISKLKIN